MINIPELEEKFNSLNKFNLVFASFFFSLMTLCVKNVDKRIPIYEIVLFRSLLSLIITLFIINLKNINPWGKNKPLLILRGILGILFLVFIAFLFSRDMKGIDWKLVIKGLSIQFIFAILILHVSFISSIFDFIGKGFVKIISFTQEGTLFLFANLETEVLGSSLINFAIMILPTVIFFSALTSLFYYWGVIPKIVYAFAWIMKRIMK